MGVCAFGGQPLKLTLSCGGAHCRQLPWEMKQILEGVSQKDKIYVWQGVSRLQRVARHKLIVSEL